VLFVYGTLRAGLLTADVAPWLAPLARRPATLPGRLLDLGAYPGALPAPPGAPEAGVEVGELVAVPPARLDELDRYEGYDPADPCRSRFVRERVVATTRNGERVPCWVYAWAGGPAGREVPGGDWAARRPSPQG